MKRSDFLKSLLVLPVIAGQKMTELRNAPDETGPFIEVPEGAYLSMRGCIVHGGKHSPIIQLDRESSFAIDESIIYSGEKP